MSAEQELKVLKDKLGRQELLVESLRKQNRELLKVVKELNDFIGKLTCGEKFPLGTLGSIANSLYDDVNSVIISNGDKLSPTEVCVPLVNPIVELDK